jgi:hypothetical protein
MKSFVFGLALCAAAFPALAQTNVSVSVGQPGFYGRVDIGDFAPRPVLYAPQPVLIERGPAYVAEPIYLRVPPGHRRTGRAIAAATAPAAARCCSCATSGTATPMCRAGAKPMARPHGYPAAPVRVVERVEYRDYPRGHHGGPGPRPRGDWNHGGPGHGGGHDGGHGHGPAMAAAMAGHGVDTTGGHGGGHGHGR